MTGESPDSFGEAIFTGLIACIFAVPLGLGFWSIGAFVINHTMTRNDTFCVCVGMFVFVMGLSIIDYVLEERRMAIIRQNSTTEPKPEQ